MSLTGNVVVEDVAFLGADATVLHAVVIGRAAKVGAGAVMVNNVPPGATVIGVSARSIS